MNKKTLWITRTAIFLCILLIGQFIGSRVATGLLQQFITGSIVNLVLIVSGIAVGYSSGITIGVLSPVLAFLLGIGPAFIQLVPGVMLGNVVIVILTGLTYQLCKGFAPLKQQVLTMLGFLVSAAVKAGILWLTIVKLILPMLTTIKPKQAEAISIAFSWPQIVTGIIGGALALVIIPPLLKVKTGK